MAFGPEGRCDRSLARSAWDRAPQKAIPVGYGPIRRGVRIDSIGDDEISNTKYVASLKKHGTHLRREIPLGLAAPDHTVPYGTVLSVAAVAGMKCLD
jgi:hypothetical protein